MTENSEIKIEDKVMAEIKSGRVKLRSKYIFLAEKVGLGGVLGLSIVLAILFFNLTLFYLKATDNLQYLSFGREGFFVFLESFPYPFIIVFILFLILSGYFITKSDFAYKKPFAYWALGITFFVLISGGVLAFTDVSEKIEEAAYSSRPAGFFLKPFYKAGFKMRERGLAGIIYEKSQEYLIIKTPHGLQRVLLNDLTLDERLSFKVGQFVMAVGERRGYDFIAHDLKIMKKGELPMTQRGINRRFGPENFNTSTPPHLPPLEDLNFSPEVKKCLEECFVSNRVSDLCFSECLKIEN